MSFRLSTEVLIIEFLLGGINILFPSDLCSPPIEILGHADQVPAQLMGINYSKCNRL